MKVETYNPITYIVSEKKEDHSVNIVKHVLNAHQIHGWQFTLTLTVLQDSHYWSVSVTDGVIEITQIKQLCA